MAEPTAAEWKGILALRQRDIEASLRLDGPALAFLWTDDAVTFRAAMQSQLAGLDVTQPTPEVVEYREDFEETLVFGDTAIEWGCISGTERVRAAGAARAVPRSRLQPDGRWLVHRSIFAPAG